MTGYGATSVQERVTPPVSFLVKTILLQQALPRGCSSTAESHTHPEVKFPTPPPPLGKSSFLEQKSRLGEQGSGTEPDGCYWRTEVLTRKKAKEQ